MREITPIKHEQDFNALEAGDRVMVNTTPYIFTNRSIDGAELVRIVRPGEAHILQIRGYSITTQGSILPIWYTEKTIPIRKPEAAP